MREITREITQEEINAKLEAHKLWWDSDMKHGEQAIFKNVLISKKSFFYQNLCNVIFEDCNIVNTVYRFANLKDAQFKNTTLSGIDFANSNLIYTDFSTAKIENILITNTIPRGVIGQRVICTQVNTSRRNNLIAYWADLGIWTTGCFQGTLEKLRKAIAKTHKNNPFLRARYERVINYILEEDKADKEREKEK